MIPPNIFTELKESYRLVVPAFLIGWLILGWTLKKIIFIRIQKFSEQTASKVDDVIVAAADGPVLFLVLLSGIELAHRLLIPADIYQQLTPLLPHILKALTIFTIILFIDRLLINLIRTYSESNEFLRAAHGLLSGLTHLFVFGLGLLVILDSFGVSITPIIASLGIGSLAVALALQPTLQNLFAGFQIIFDQPVRPGQFIRLESGEEGFVERVGWRSTWIRQPTNNVVIIPNNNLVNSRVLNYHYPTPDVVVVVNVGVHYSSDLEKVETITNEVATKIMKSTPGGVPDFQPMVRYNKFDASSINFAVIMKGKHIGDTGLITHEFIKALTIRYNKEGIVIPYPIMALNTGQEKVEIGSVEQNGKN